MKDTFTIMETLTTYDGNTIVFKKDQVIKFYKTIYEINYANLTKEEKEEAFEVDHNYGDLLIKIWKEPLQNYLKEIGSDMILFREEDRNPLQEYYHVTHNCCDDDETLGEHELKMQRLKHNLEWYQKRIKK